MKLHTLLEVADASDPKEFLEKLASKKIKTVKDARREKKPTGEKTTGEKQPRVLDPKNSPQKLKRVSKNLLSRLPTIYLKKSTKHMMLRLLLAP